MCVSLGRTQKIRWAYAKSTQTEKTRYTVWFSLYTQVTNIS